MKNLQELIDERREPKNIILKIQQYFVMLMN